MKRLLCSFVALSAWVAQAAEEAPKILTSFLPVKQFVRGEIVVIVPPEELDKYVSKVEAASRKNPEWFREHAKNSKPGVPLPYDERLGLTKEEYDEYLKIWGKREFKPIEAVRIQLSPAAGGAWKINTVSQSGSAQAISTLSYDPKEDTFHSPNGVLKRLEDVHADANSTLGAWDGHEWKFEEVTSLGTSKENIALGKTGDKKYGLIVYRFQEVTSQGTKLADRGMVIRFPLGEAGIVKPATPQKPKAK